MHNPTRRIIEIGHGGRPLRMKPENFLRKLSPEVEYLGVELPNRGKRYRNEHKKPNRFLKSTIREFQSQTECFPNVTLLRLNAIRIGRQIGEFDEVHIHNLINDPNVDRLEFWDMINEARRLLKERGYLIVTTHADLWTDDFSVARFQVNSVFGRVVGDGLHLSDASVFAREIRNSYLDWDPRMAIIATK
jgi:hypothetical protein